MKPGHIIDTLLTDSKGLTRPCTSLFFAIRTPGGNDGHKFMRGLYDRGVRNFVAEKLPEDMKGTGDVSVIITQDSVKALQDVGAMASRLEAEIVAITGSRGKTTLKEWIFQLITSLRNSSLSTRLQLPDWRASVDVAD